MTDTINDRLGRSVPDSFPSALREHGLLINTAPGLYGWGIDLETIQEGLRRRLTAVAGDLRPTVMRFPPLLPRTTFEQSEYVSSFPHLFGAVHAFRGDEDAHAGLERAIAGGEDWSGHTRLTDFVLAPASCHAVYPLHSPTVPDDGVAVDVDGWCFRHEPSTEPGRLVAFQMREFVRIGTATDAVNWSADWRERSLATVRSLGLPAEIEAASDPFFGTAGAFLADDQRNQSLKLEILAPVGERRVAVASVNYHQDHFGRIFGIQSADGVPAHSACAAFGLERLTFALVAAHGPDLDRWPDQVRDLL
ncbi:hypothetical protein [Salinispora arenicola]|uniref:hypothetical protein n=1 Tax=Salinispora arenicola TaxID=168697 RepID=UPI000362EFD4|nr:hypothetical protein [Salinispora arenicola]